MASAAAAAADHSPPPRPLVFAFYLTGHGFCHATRAIEVIRHLVAAGHDVHLATAVPEFVFTAEVRSPRLRIRRVLLDCGAVQADALTVDPLATLEKYHETAVVPRESILRAEAEWLTSIKADLVVSDVVPVVCRVAADVGVRSVCIGNFSWDFIYAEYIMEAGYHHRSIVWQIAEDYSHCDILLRLPGYCPMPAFRDVIDVPLVVRGLRKSRSEVRKELGIEENSRVLIFNFGGQPAGWELKQEWLPDGWICLVCGASDSQDVPPNFIKLAKDAYTPDVMAASDCMLGKIGYGNASEALAYKLPFVFVRRDYFNEEPFLRNLLEHYQNSIEMIRRDFLTGHWKPYLLRAITLQPCYDGSINGGEVVAQILQDTAFGKKCISDKFSGARRLQDAIVSGYQLQRALGRDVGIPDWYSASEAENCAGPTSKNVETKESSESMNPSNRDEGGDDNTGFGRGVPMQGYYGGWNPGLQPSPQMYPFFHGGLPAALNQGYMPLQNAPLSAASPAQMPAVVAPTVDSVEPAVMKECQGDGEGGSLPAARRRKGVHSRIKLSNFSPKEDVFLVKSWLEISCGPIINTGQKREGFWARITSQYNKKRDSYPERTLRSLQSRWESIKAESSKFAGYMANVLRDNPSGMSDANKTSLALANFADSEQYPFIYVHCWDLLKDEPKWMELNIRGARAGEDDPIADHLPSGAINIDDDPPTPSQYSGSKRPKGRDAAKRAAKKSASSSPSESSRYISKLQNLSIQKLSIWQEENAKKGSRYEQMAAIDSQRYEELRAHNQQMAAIEEEKLRLMRKKDEREQTCEEERILAIDLDKCAPRLRKYYEKKQQEIMQSIGANEDDSVDP